MCLAFVIFFWSILPYEHSGSSKILVSFPICCEHFTQSLFLFWHPLWYFIKCMFLSLYNMYWFFLSDFFHCFWAQNPILGWHSFWWLLSFTWYMLLISTLLCLWFCAFWTPLTASAQNGRVRVGGGVELGESLWPSFYLDPVRGDPLPHQLQVHHWDSPYCLKSLICF